MTPRIFTDGLRPPLGPVRGYLQSAPDARLVDESVVAGHDPTVAPQYFCFRAWVPVTEEQVIAYATAWDLVVPQPHREFLLQLNGLFFRRADLFGIPPSMLASPPRLDRSRPQPLDLRAASLHWRHDYRDHGDLFHLGSFWFSHTETAGLFLDTRGHVVAALKSGKRVAEWPGYEELVLWVFRRPETGV